MPFVRSARGTRSRFSSAKVSATLSAAYTRAYGAGTAPKWRQKIQRHTTAVIRALEKNLGRNEADEWSRERIALAIEHELRQNAAIEIQEAYLDQHPSIAQHARATETDPVWSIQRAGEPSSAREVAAENPMDGLGETVRRVQARRQRQTPTAPGRPPSRRSGWLAFWQALSRRALHPLDWSAFLRCVESQPANQRHQSSTQWWRTWQDWLDQAVLEDPRLYALWGVAETRRARAAIVGQDWLEGSDLDPQGRVGLLTGAPGEEDSEHHAALYRRLAEEHFRRLVDQGILDSRFPQSFRLDELCAAMDPARDRRLDWRALQRLATHGCLWPISPLPWVAVEARPLTGATELPQWAFLRLAMAMAIDEREPMAWARRFYEQMSLLCVVPSETLLREGGAPGARYLEDQAARVPDSYESVQTALHRASVGTKWTGTVTLDWRAVRGKGSLVAGRRVSPGIMGFLEPLDKLIASQGRPAGERPVTVVLPLWHLEAPELLDAQERIPHLQAVLAIPDAFFQRLKTGSSWYLFDPDVFPEVADGTPDGYLAAEREAAERAKLRPQAVRRVSSTRLWRRLLKATHKGSPFLLFEDAQRPFTPFPISAPPVAGIDGVGSLPCLPDGVSGHFQAVAWPSAAVNLIGAIADDGTPQLDALKASTAVAVRLLDNALTASCAAPEGATGLFRPICLGAIGLYEAIDYASSIAGHDPGLVDAWVSGLAEAWAVSVIQADQDLVRERGAAPGWGQFHDGQPFDPIHALERLTILRQGSRALSLTPRQDWNRAARSLRQSGGHRCSVRTVWAPFLGAAAIAGVTPGGIGTLVPHETIVDESGHRRLTPSALLLHHVHREPERLAEWREVLRTPFHPKRWPEALVTMVRPDRVQWERRLQHAAMIRPWVDQGMSVTLPAGLPEDMLHSLIQRAWWLGLNSLRFAVPWTRHNENDARPAREGGAETLDEETVNQKDGNPDDTAY